MSNKLTDKQRAFIEFYLSHWNATKAAIDAGYSEKTARVIGPENLSKPAIAAAIAARLAELKMSADEVLTRLTAHARGSIAPFLVTNDKGVPVSFNLSPDRPLHLVKKVSITDKGISFEVYDAQAALALLGRAHGIFIERTETTIDFIGDAAESLDRKLLPGDASGAPAGIPGEPDST